MADPNTWRGWIEDSNSQKDTSNIYAQLVRDYSKQKLKDPSTRSEYLRSLEGTTTVSSDIIEDIKKFATKDQEGDYDGLTISTDEIQYGALRRESAWFFASIASNRRSVKDIFLQEFDLTEAELSGKIDTPLNALSELEIQDLHDSEKTRKVFLEKYFWKGKLPKEKSIANFLKDMTLEDSYKLVKADEEIAFYDVVQKIKSWQELGDLDIETLLGSWAYTFKQKQALIQKLLPSISIAQARRFHLIENKHAVDLKDEYIRLTNPDLHRGAVREISSTIADEDIIIATSKFTDLKKNVDTIIENPTIFNGFIDKYNSKIRWFKEEIEGTEIKKSEDFIHLLWEHGRVSGAEKLKKWAIIQIRQTEKKSDGNTWESLLFWKITELSEDGTFSYNMKWDGDGSYDAGGSMKETLTYSDFLKFVTDGNPQKWISLRDVTVFSAHEFDGKLNSGEIEESNSDILRLPSKSQITSDITSMTRDINELKEAIRSREVQIRNDLSDQWYDDWYIKEHADEVISGDPTIQKLKAQLQDIQERQYQKTQSLDDLEWNHLEILKQKINEIDDKGKKHGLWKWTVLKTKSGDIFTITQEPNLASGEIQLTSIWDHQTCSFENFYKAFKSQDTKRVATAAADFWDMFENLHADGTEKMSSWKNFAFHNGKIQKKDSQKKIEYNYLGSKEHEELIKIHDISGDQITISFWKLSSKSRVKGWELVRGDNEQVVKDEKFSMENREYIVTTWFLEQYIKDNSYEPRWLKESQEVSADVEWVDAMNKKTKFWSLMFHERATIADAVKWGNLFVEQMKEMLAMGSDEKANQFALKYMWAVLPADAKRDMQSRLEQKQKKSMEDYLERLKTVASDVAIRMIEEWLHDKYAPDYMHEAAVVFMLEKYWVLNAKWWLQKYEWKWIWYQALGWEIDDPFFKKIKAEKEDASLPFTEELLVYRLLKKQCGQHGFNGVKRRSKLHKEVKKHRATGKEEEYETGKRDGNDERTLEGRVEWGMGEMYGNNYPNMVWWLEVAVNKWWPMHIMNKIPFIAAFSGVAYNFEEKTTDQLKNFPGGTRLLMMLRFFSYHRDLDLLNNTILAVCKTLQRQWDPKFAEIWDKASELHASLRDQWGWVEKKLKRTEIFYEQYGEELTKILYMLNTGNKGDVNNKLIFFEKDNAENPDSHTLKQYYETLHAFVADTKFEDEDLMSDAFKWSGTSGIELHKFSEHQLNLSRGKFRKHTSWAISWTEVEKEFRAIPQRQYDSDPEVNRKMQMKLLSDNLGRFISGIMLASGTNASELAGYNTPTWPFNRLNDWWVDMTRFKEDPDFNIHDMMHPKPGSKTEELLQEFSRQIIEAETSDAEFSEKVLNEFWPNGRANSVEGASTTSIASSVDRTKARVSNTTSKLPTLDDED